MKYLSYTVILLYIFLVLLVSGFAVRLALAGDDNPQYIEHWWESLHHDVVTAPTKTPKLTLPFHPRRSATSTPASGKNTAIPPAWNGNGSATGTVSSTLPAATTTPSGGGGTHTATSTGSHGKSRK
jgi:hypothetical protein